MLNTDPVNLNGPGLFVFNWALTPVPRLKLVTVPLDRLKTISPPFSLKSQPPPPQPVGFMVMVTETTPVLTSVTVTVPRTPVAPMLLLVRLKVVAEATGAIAKMARTVIAIVASLRLVIRTTKSPF